MPVWRKLVEASKYQVYLSRSLDPFFNLSVEHFLLQKSPPYSTVLFLYVNRPCVVIGRNQNPWLEVDLQSMRQCRAAGSMQANGGVVPSHWWDDIVLVRRRSGGGTVFHDEGNVNYSVICPTADFTRDKHAEMVTKAIRELNSRARVNERHDIVLDQGDVLPENKWPLPLDMHQTRFHPSSRERPPLKISGSAYKLTRQRSLHHGTCLLASADLPGISQLLRSPARPFIKARGVESVPSPIGNIYGKSDMSHQNHNDTFQMEVIKTFHEMYETDKQAPEDSSLERIKSELRSDSKGEYASGPVDHKLEHVEEIRAGIEELRVRKSVSRMDLPNIACNHSLQNGSTDRRHNSYYPATLWRKMTGSDPSCRSISQHQYVQSSRALRMVSYVVWGTLD